MGWTWQNARHAAGLARQGANPAAVVYESTGADFFLAPALRLTARRRCRPAA
jgi:hypothetical protein